MSILRDRSLDEFSSLLDFMNKVESVLLINIFKDKSIYLLQQIRSGLEYALPMSKVRAIRGATQCSANSAEAIDVATKELLKEILRANKLIPSEVISIIFTVSPDLNAAFPASSARELGFEEVPLLCSVEIGVPGSLQRTIRVLAHVETELEKSDIAHIYLGGAKSLRRDIAQ
jgi:chorismate mutase